MNKYILIFFLLIISKRLLSQKDTLEISIKNRAKEVIEAWKINHDNSDFNRFFFDNYQLSYKYFKEYENDSLKKVLEVVVSKYFMLAVDNKDKTFKRRIVEDLLSIAVNHVSIKNDYDPFSILTTLLIINNNFRVDDFNKNSKKKIGLLFKDKTSYSSVLLVGFVGLKDQISELKKFLPEKERYTKSRFGFWRSFEWAARLALARLGDKEQINFCLEKVKAVDLLENSYGYGEYMDYLIYIKQPEVLPYLFELLLANESFRDQPIYTSSAPGMYALRELLEDFPPEVGGALTEKGVEKYKKWVEDHKGKYKFKE